MQTTTLDLSADVIDVRDIIARVEELETIIGDSLDAESVQMAMSEHQELTALLNELAGYGGDEQWRGDWYPVTLIRDSYFIDYVRELLEDCGDIPRNLPHYIAIDWKKTAMNIRQDYSHISLDATYWYR